MSFIFVKEKILVIPFRGPIVFIRGKVICGIIAVSINAFIEPVQ